MGLVGHSRSRNIPFIGVWKTMLLRVMCLGKKFSEERNVSMGSRDETCDILVKNVASFCPCPKSLPEAKLKTIRLIVRRNFKTA